MCYNPSIAINNNREKKKQENSPKIPEKGTFQSVLILPDEEKMAKERKKKLKELLIQTFKENHQVGIVTSLCSAFCSVNDKGLHQRCDSVTLSPTEPCYKYQTCPHHLLCATQLTQYIREHFDLLFRSYSYILCVILRNWGYV